jgi:hypothetical protein
MVNEELVAGLTDSERAAVGYVATLIGSRCDNDGPVYPEQRIKCALTAALGLGQQCEEQHWAFLRKWLGNDKPRSCYHKPATAYSQTDIDRLLISHLGNEIILAVKADGTEGPEGPSYEWSERLVFEERDGGVRLVEEKIDGNPHPDREYLRRLPNPSPSSSAAPGSRPPGG